jgi:hypothetical protein
MDFDLQHSVLKHAADDSVESSVALGLVRRRDSLPPGVSGAEEPPEHTQFRAQRIFLSLCIQIIARFFVHETVPAHGPDAVRESEDSNVSGVLLFSVSNCSRSEMIARVRLFRSTGAEALFALAIVKSDSRVLLTAADKQFALWTLREVCVAAYEVESSEGNSLMIWCELKSCFCN